MGCRSIQGPLGWRPQGTTTSTPGFISMEPSLASGWETSGRGSAEETLLYNTLPPICCDPEPQSQKRAPPQSPTTPPDRAKGELQPWEGTQDPPAQAFLRESCSEMKNPLTSQSRLSRAAGAGQGISMEQHRARGPAPSHQSHTARRGQLSHPCSQQRLMNGGANYSQSAAGPARQRTEPTPRGKAAAPPGCADLFPCRHPREGMQGRMQRGLMEGSAPALTPAPIFPRITSPVGFYGSRLPALPAGRVLTAPSAPCSWRP